LSTRNQKALSNGPNKGAALELCGNRHALKVPAAEFHVSEYTSRVFVKMQEGRRSSIENARLTLMKRVDLTYAGK
jgi:hypothetical protein